jgi:hypothetical protein
MEFSFTEEDLKRASERLLETYVKKLKLSDPIIVKWENSKEFYGRYSTLFTVNGLVQEFTFNTCLLRDIRKAKDGKKLNALSLLIRTILHEVGHAYDRKKDELSYLNSILNEREKSKFERKAENFAKENMKDGLKLFVGFLLKKRGKKKGGKRK